MLSTVPITGPRPSTTGASGSATGSATVRVTLEVALVAELVVDVVVDGDDREQQEAAARAAAASSPARAAWDERATLAARALRTDLLGGRQTLVAGLTVHAIASSEPPRLLVQALPVGPD